MASLDFGPRIFDAWLCENGGAFVMEMYDMTFSTFMGTKDIQLKRQMMDAKKNLLKKFSDAGFNHGDLHDENIVVRLPTTENEGQVRFIDFLTTCLKTDMKCMQEKYWFVNKDR
jgi:hypothetical protein